jgi:hypothetical protein
MSVSAYFRAKDNKPPPGIKRGLQRRTYHRTRGPWTVDVTSSCGFNAPHISGSVTLTLTHASMQEDTKPLVKRFGVDNWDEAMQEITRLWDMLSSPVNRGLMLEEIQ